MSGKVVKLDAIARSLDEIVEQINEDHKAGVLKDLCVVGGYQDGSALIGFSQQPAMRLVFNSLYLQKAIEKEMRAEGMLPG